MTAFAEDKLTDGRARLVRHGYLKTTLEAIAVGRPRNRINDLLPKNFRPSSANSGALKTPLTAHPRQLPHWIFVVNLRRHLRNKGKPHRQNRIYAQCECQIPEIWLKVRNTLDSAKCCGIMRG
ncbi:transposase domain-containing protein [Sedimentitalea nanhaiensis]|uniref:transposase domain-containing protein n=1 Tax=Sedimentitalea nanhaiensis TaxID=999627 RepID=UPI000AD330E8|nr:transposase domain-containing protein [Sedimentitalea nanhaiensis]